MKKNFVLFVFSVSLLCSACRVSHEVAQTNVEPQKIVSQEPEKQAVNQATPSVSVNKEQKLDADTAKKILAKQDTTITEPYQWVSYRGKVNINLDGKQYSANYFFVNRIDSIIYINVNVYGIEVARMVATPSEVVFVNKLSYEYYKGDYAFVEKYLKTKADFYTLQAVFNGWDDQLKEYSNINFSYQRCTLQDVHRPFFSHFDVDIDSGKRSGKLDVTNARFNVPGPTGIKIPESFTPIKL